MGKTNNKTNLPAAFKHNDTWLTNIKESAFFMNKFYATVGPSTNESVGMSTREADHYMLKHCERNSNFFLRVSKLNPFIESNELYLICTLPFLLLWE